MDALAKLSALCELKTAVCRLRKRFSRSRLEMMRMWMAKSPSRVQARASLRQRAWQGASCHRPRTGHGG